MTAIRDLKYAEWSVSLRVHGEDPMHPLVQVFPDGRIEYSDKYEPDEFARILWTSLAESELKVEPNVAARALRDLLWELNRFDGSDPANERLNELVIAAWRVIGDAEDVPQEPRDE